MLILIILCYQVSFLYISSVWKTTALQILFISFPLYQLKSLTLFKTFGGSSVSRRFLEGPST